jgi:RNA polymerase subunit RPABC4/transcription elongation factor Spt4
MDTKVGDITLKFCRNCHRIMAVHEKLKKCPFCRKKTLIPISIREAD